MPDYPLNKFSEAVADLYRALWPPHAAGNRIPPVGCRAAAGRALAVASDLTVAPSSGCQC